ncbi:MAG: hypothetical protein ACYC33_06160 [Thermoleophilia bacterium]
MSTRIYRLFPFVLFLVALFFPSQVVAATYLATMENQNFITSPDPTFNGAYGTTAMISPPTQPITVHPGTIKILSAVYYPRGGGLEYYARAGWKLDIGSSQPKSFSEGTDAAGDYVSMYKRTDPNNSWGQYRTARVQYWSLGYYEAHIAGEWQRDYYLGTGEYVPCWAGARVSGTGNDLHGRVRYAQYQMEKWQANSWVPFDIPPDYVISNYPYYIYRVGTNAWMDFDVYNHYFH